MKKLLNNPFNQFKLFHEELIKLVSTTNMPTERNGINGITTESQLNKTFPYHMVLSTCSNNIPTSRVVMLRDFNEKGLKFYTSHQSRKGKDIKENSICSVNFNWFPIKKQIIIRGNVERLSEEVSDLFFKTRPISAQISVLVSKQSEVIEDDYDFEKELKKYDNHNKDNLKRPNSWGGYNIIPNMFEFWSDENDKLTYGLGFIKRVRYTKIKRERDNENDNSINRSARVNKGVIKGLSTSKDSNNSDNNTNSNEWKIELLHP